MTAQREWRRERNAKIVKAAQEGKTRGMLANEFALCESAISLILREAGATTARPKRSAPDASEQGILDTYRGGKSARQTAQIHGVPFQRVLLLVHRWIPGEVRPAHHGRVA